ncbi:glycosyltransferase family 2 protein [Neolewinella lacunae]|uniref:Glycosyltransferase family 2 protein n=1 Tax=Neolewinella lacunae TaxID=1517758 RepID=A0A923PKC3_9BACT|nr:glycosyltransferase family 2 protein [Neolewinella lacunae]MBC6994145.1 glycosyltransferase family 2 protein [Neolewinella lacunae]MDN3636706.1 glycosyltransferase family 2 protein [Neolewinella lacunae]
MESNTLRLAILILNFRGVDDTLDCLASLRAAQLDGAHLWLLDNGSADDSANRLQSWNDREQFFPHTIHLSAAGHPTEGSPGTGHHLLFSPVNLGFAAGNNLLTRLAMDQGYEEVLLLNNDTTVAPDFLRWLRAAREVHPTAVLIPQIRLYAEPGRVWNCGGALRWPGRKKYHFANAPVDRLPAADYLPVSFVTGCALLFRPQRTGLLTERFFFGEEDVEFSWRLRTNGMVAVCCLRAVVYHKVGQSLATNARKSEVFTLRRLVNLKTARGGLTAACGFAFHLANLVRILMMHYRLGPGQALASAAWIGRAALRLDTVGKAWCVDYVLGLVPKDRLP